MESDNSSEIMALQIPERLYRGFHGQGADPAASLLGCPTYTDSARVAAVYGLYPNQVGRAAAEPRLAVATVSSLRPVQLNGYDEDVVEWGHLCRLLQLEDAARDAFRASLQIPFRRDGEWLTGAHRGEALQPNDYTDTYRLADSPVVRDRLSQLGYDLLVSRGTFPDETCLSGLESFPLGSYSREDLSVLEYRPLSAGVLNIVEVFPLDQNAPSFPAAVVEDEEADASMR